MSAATVIENESCPAKPCQNAVAEIRGLLGPDVVLLDIPRGEKGPSRPGWQQTSKADMERPEYLAKLSAGGNIGVLLGQPSGGICSIDVDDDAALETLLKLNPRLRQTLRTRGRRGGNLWVKIAGEYPALTKVKANGEAWGEWRADGGQTVIYGKHPSGVRYQIVHFASPVDLRFDEINWPDNLELPWLSNMAVELVKDYGEPFVTDEEGKPCGLNERFWAALTLRENRLLHEPNEREFYEYEPACGLWKPKTFDALMEHVSARLFEHRKEHGLSLIERLIKQSRVKPIVEHLRGMAERRDAFMNKARVIHLANGVIRFAANGDVQFGGFNPDDFSRNQSPIEFDANAECLRFKEELLAPALNAEDIDLLQRWFGVALFGVNLPQRILILTGTPGGGKSTLAIIIGSVIGRQNVYQLRTECLGERFETFRYRRKTLLVGADVPGDFLMQRGSPALKALVGGDLLSAEAKCSNGDFPIRGTFNVLITCNSRLRVRLDGDTGAWRRRLLIVNYEKPAPEKKIQNFADMLVKEEGPGIVRWALQGFIKAMAEFNERGDFCLTDEQAARGDGLLAESESVENFLRARIVKEESGDVSSDELTQEYAEFCADRGWNALPVTAQQKQFTDLMLRLFQVVKSHSIERAGKSVRGWRGARLKL